MYLERSLSFSYISWLNNLLCLFCLTSNFALVIPVYETCSLTKEKAALYIIQLERQFQSSGHLVGCLQLHVFVAALCFFHALFCHVLFFNYTP